MTFSCVNPCHVSVLVGRSDWQTCITTVRWMGDMCSVNRSVLLLPNIASGCCAENCSSPLRRMARNPAAGT